MLRIEDADDLSNPTRALLAEKGYVESARGTYAHWKDVQYTRGDLIVILEYSGRAGNLKRVRFVSESDVWKYHATLSVDASNGDMRKSRDMYLDGYMDLFVHGDSFVEKLHTVLADPEPYCVLAAAAQENESARRAEALERAFGDAFRQNTAEPRPPVR